jgi:Domain of unknown function (DUF6089)
MKTNIFIFVLHSFCALTPIYSQQQIQGGLSIGGINYEGDLAPSSFFVSAAETHLDLGAFVYVKANDWLGLKLHYHHGKLSGSDALSNNEGRRARNLSFRSPLDELSVSGAFFYTYNTQKQKTIQPFLTFGIGVFHFNPQAEYEGHWYDLQPLSTEGQGLANYPNRKPYALTQICFPVGAGIQMSLTKRVLLTFDLSLRKTMTDYLDDVSMTYPSADELTLAKGKMAAILSDRSAIQKTGNRGIAKNKDWYVIGSMGLVANIWGGSKKNNFFQKKTDYMDCKKSFKKRKNRS